MTVRNYYTLDEPELEKAVKTIRSWLWEHDGHPNSPKALFALEVCLCATKIERDQFIQDVIDTLCVRDIE